MTESEGGGMVREWIHEYVIHRMEGRSETSIEEGMPYNEGSSRGKKGSNASQLVIPEFFVKKRMEEVVIVDQTNW